MAAHAVVRFLNRLFIHITNLSAGDIEVLKGHINQRRNTDANNGQANSGGDDNTASHWGFPLTHFRYPIRLNGTQRSE